MSLVQGYLPSDLVDDLSALVYIIKGQIYNRVNTIDIVKVLKVNDDDTLDVIPIIKDTNPANEPIDESPIYGIRYIKWQFGKNSLKAKPEVGDIGLILICKKDTSSIDAGIIGSKAKYNPADGIYLGGLNGLNQEPTQFIEFKQDEVNITGTGTIKIVAPTVNIEATTANVNATAINLGGQGGKPVARQGDNVVAGTTVIGQIQAGSSKVFAVD
ncbi:MAG: hypothetical protein J6S67_09985 [Methanobrevibacter sp.]|nr:hypothetical protein [Methanobrevibacter sp.]